MDLTVRLLISEISETWVPPHGQPGLSPSFTMRGVLSWKRLEMQKCKIAVIS